MVYAKNNLDKFIQTENRTVYQGLGENKHGALFYGYEFLFRGDEIVMIVA